MLNCYCREHLICYAFLTLAFIALLSRSVAVQAHQLIWLVGDIYYNAIFEFYTRW